MTDPQTIATEMTERGTFSLIERLQGRNMPEEDRTIYLDEGLAWDLFQLEVKHNNAKRKDEVEEIERKLKTVREKLAKSAYTFTLRGMTNERYDSLVDQTLEQFPYDYEESVNPLSGVKVKNIIPNEERDALFNTLFLAESIVKVTDPDGNVDENITPEVVAFIKKLAPLDGIRLITEVATRMRLAVEWMDAVQDEDFSPRP